MKSNLRQTHIPSPLKKISIDANPPNFMLSNIEHGPTFATGKNQQSKVKLMHLKKAFYDRSRSAIRRKDDTKPEIMLSPSN